MKKIILFAAVLSSFFLITVTGCQSVKADLNNYSPVAIITSYSNNAVPWHEEQESNSTYKVTQEDKGVLTGLINRAISKNSPEYTEVQHRIDLATETFAATLREYGLTVLDPSVVAECSIYKKAGKTFFDSVANTIPATGYDAITTSSKKVNKTVAAETGAKSLCYVHFKFQKVKAVDGAHEYGARARVVMNVYIADSNGKTLLSKEYTALSAGYVPLGTFNGYDAEALCTMFPEVISTCVNRFAMDYVFNTSIDNADSDPDAEEEIITFERKN